MTYFFKSSVLFITLSVFISCESNNLDKSLKSESLTSKETEQVNGLLKKLYQSFCYGETEEPDWELMRSVFVQGAQFVGETPVGEPPQPQTIEAFILSWQNSIRSSNTPTTETSEEIIQTKTTKIGKMIRVDVLFKASKSNDSSPRKPGLDSLLLANVNGEWKILSFVIHYESKL